MSSTKIELISENELDKKTLAKIKSAIGQDVDLAYGVDQSRFKEKIEVVTAIELNDQQLNKIKSIFGEKAEIILKIDKDIIGGIKIRTRNKLYDGSIKTQINKLKQNLYQKD